MMRLRSFPAPGKLPLANEVTHGIGAREALRGGAIERPRSLPGG
jgi:hypothetical protein